MKNIPPTLLWTGKAVKIIEQTLLPEKYKQVVIKTPAEMWQAIKRLAVRGAPAIGCAAAYGVILGVNLSRAKTSAALVRDVEKTAWYLSTSRPTAVNLFWAVERMVLCARDNMAMPLPHLKKRLLAEAESIFTEDQEMCLAIGRNGARLIKSKNNNPFGILTQCNAGALATSGIGTALAVIYTAWEKNKNIQVYADETRPLCQGSRLTAWELARVGVPVTLI